MSTPRPWRLGFVVAPWLVLILGGAVISVPFVALLSMALVPLGAAGIVLAVVLIPSGGLWERALAAAAALFLAGLAVHAAGTGAWTVMAWDRASQPGGGAGTPTAGPGYWLLVLGLNLLGAAVLFMANKLRLGDDRRTNLRLTLLLGSTPAAALVGLFVASRFLPLDA
jgi:hypothetical protein